MAKKNKKFLSRRSGYKGSRKEDQKGCFNRKKPGHFIDCPDLQKDKLKDKSKKSTFKLNKIKKSLMATLENLDSESESGKDDADEGYNLCQKLQEKCNGKPLSNHENCS